MRQVVRDQSDIRGSRRPSYAPGKESSKDRRERGRGKEHTPGETADSARKKGFFEIGLPSGTGPGNSKVPTAQPT